MAYNETYDADDISPAVMDGLVSFIAQLVPFATLLALGVILIFLMNIWKKITKR